MFALLRRGLIAGIIAGLLAGLVGLAVGESALQHAINFEETGSTAAVTTQVDAAAPADDHAAAGHDTAARHDHGEEAVAAAGGHSHGEEEELVSRPWQRFGLVLATTLSGGAIGVLLALVYAFRRTRRPDEDAWTAALWLGLAGALAWLVFPLILTPPNPPGIGNPATISERTYGYLGAVAGGVAVTWLASRLVRALPAGRPRWQPVAAVALTVVAGLALLWLVVPAPATPPAGFPADLLWRFRLASAGVQGTLWAVLTIAFATLVDRRPAEVAAPAAASEPVAA
ncbi:MAG: CbtA family protein [Solirubrobacteraceae bacterium]|nr:CbtA family protein [Solirubrobacteraceae bacterium]